MSFKKIFVKFLRTRCCFCPLYMGEKKSKGEISETRGILFWNTDIFLLENSSCSAQPASQVSKRVFLLFCEKKSPPPVTFYGEVEIGRAERR
jgi:hypothetical protein